MSEKKWGKTVMGWFLVNENEPKGATTEAALIEKYANVAPAPPPVELKGELPRAQGGALDFSKIFLAAGLSAAEQERIDKAKNLLKDLPGETPVQVRKQIVGASLRAFGIPVRDIIESGVEEIQALEAYIQSQGQTMRGTVADGNQRIAKLNDEIADIKKIIQQAVDDQTEAEKLCNQHKLTIQQVLEFFGQEAVAAVVKESPKLHEPAQT